MSGVYGYPQSGPHRPQVAVPRLVAAALLVVAAALALGGSFGAFSVYRFESEYTPTTTTTTTGWGTTEDPASGSPVVTEPVLHGIPLTVAAVLAVVAAVLLVLAARSPGDPPAGRLLGVGAVGLLVGVVTVIWLELITFTRNVAAAVEQAGTDSGFSSTMEIGGGGYVILAAALAALVAAALLLVPRRDGGPVPPPGSVPPFGPGAPPWGGPAQWYPPQGPAAPQPGWGPPPPHHG